MVSEKVIVILLIITIILSVVSIAVTLTMNFDAVKIGKQKNTRENDNSGSISLVIENPSGAVK